MTTLPGQPILGMPAMIKSSEVRLGRQLFLLVAAACPLHLGEVAQGMIKSSEVRRPWGPPCCQPSHPGNARLPACLLATGGCSCGRRGAGVRVHSAWCARPAPTAAGLAAPCAGGEEPGVGGAAGGEAAAEQPGRRGLAAGHHGRRAGRASRHGLLQAAGEAAGQGLERGKESGQGTGARAPAGCRGGCRATGRSQAHGRRHALLQGAAPEAWDGSGASRVPPACLAAAAFFNLTLLLP